MKNPIKKIELDLDGKKVSLTPEQAKSLKSALNELFGKDGWKEYIPYPVYPARPYYWEWRYPDCYFSTTGGTAVTYCSDSSTLKLTA
jgi:hypothetical protein